MFPWYSYLGAGVVYILLVYGILLALGDVSDDWPDGFA